MAILVILGILASGFTIICLIDAILDYRAMIALGRNGILKMLVWGSIRHETFRVVSQTIGVLALAKVINWPPSFAIVILIVGVSSGFDTVERRVIRKRYAQ